MPYVDNNLVVSGGISAIGQVIYQVVTGANVSVLSTNTIDLGAARDIGAGTDYVRLRASLGSVTPGSATIEIQAIVADDAALSSNVTVIGSSGTIPGTGLVSGARFDVELNTRFLNKGQRYLGARYVIVGTGFAGAFLTDFGDGIEDFKAYPSGFAVL